MKIWYNIVLKWGKPSFYYTYSYYGIEIQYNTSLNKFPV